LVPAIERGVEENKNRLERAGTQQAVSIAEGIMLRSPVVVYQANLNWLEHPIYISKNFTMFDFDVQEFRLQQTPFSQIIHPDDLERISAEVFRHNKLKVDSYILQYRIINTAKEVYGVKDYVTVLRNEQGEIIQREGSLIWITEMEMSPMKQQENFEIYKSLFQDSAELLLIVAPETLNIIDANLSACNFYGYSHEQILKKKVFDLSTKSMDELHTEFAKAIKTKHYRSHDRHKLSDGQLRIMEIHADEVNLGGVDYIRLNLFDVTQQNTVEKIPGNFDNYKNLLDILPNSTMITDLQHSILYANPGCINLFGYSANMEMIGKSRAEWLGPIYVQMFAEQHIVETLINDGQLPSMKVEMINKSGALFWNSLDLRLIKDAEGNPESLLTVFSDTSKQHRAFQDTKRSEQQFQPNFDSSSIASALVTMDDSFIQVNPAFVSMMHWENIDYSQFTMPDLVSEPDHELYSSATKQLVDKQKDAVQWECKLKVSADLNLAVLISASLISFELIPQYYLIRIEETAKN
jgi:PAS domain S-box-containing protein